MLASKSFENLAVWQDSLAFVKEIYVVTNTFPDEEKGGLSLRIRNASIDVTSCISKGFSNKLAGGHNGFLNDAFNALNELETLLMVAGELNYVSAEDLEAYKLKIDNIGQLISNLQRKLDREKSA